MATVDLSLIARVSAGANGPVQSQTASSSITISNYQVNRVTLANGVSDFIVSVAHLSGLAVVIVTSATSICRINMAGLNASAFSAGSAGIRFKDLFVVAGSGTSMTEALHFANSSGDSATFTLIFGQ
jgi:hypothetical protein